MEDNTNTSEDLSGVLQNTIIWFRWENGEITPKWKKIDFEKEKMKELYKRINRMLRN